MSEVVKEVNEEKSSLETRYEDIGRLAEDLNYSEEQAEELVNTFRFLYDNEEDYNKYLKAREDITFGRLIPIGLVTTVHEWLATDDFTKRMALWEAGLDTDHEFVLDVLCTTLQDRRYCGLCVYGKERTDKEWVEMYVDGQRVASMEAQLAYNDDPTLDAELRRLSRGA